MKLNRRLSKILDMLHDLAEKSDTPVEIKIKILEAALEVEKIRREDAESA